MQTTPVGCAVNVGVGSAFTIRLRVATTEAQLPDPGTV